MSGRYEIGTDKWGEPTINGTRAIEWSDLTMVKVIAQMSDDLAAVSAERDRLAERLSRPAHAHLDGEHMNGTVDGCLLCQAITERDQLRAQIGEYENAPVVAVVRADYTGDYIDRVSKMPPIGTELIARLKATP